MSVSSLVHSPSEWITVQHLAQFLTGFVIYKFSLLVIVVVKGTPAARHDTEENTL